MAKFSAAENGLLASNMSQEASQTETFPVLIGDEIAYYHTVSGGYSKKHNADIVNLVHKVQDVGSPYRISPEQASKHVEAHLDNYYSLDVGAMRVTDEYPDRDYTLSLKVDGYQKGPHSFSEALSADADNRETRHDG